VEGAVDPREFSDVTNGADRRSRNLVDHSRVEAEVVHDVSETEVEARVLEVGKAAAVGPCEIDVSHARQ